MVAEPWIHKMRRATSLKMTMKKKKDSESPEDDDGAGGAGGSVGILSFEVASAMSRAVHLHRSLTDAELSHLFSNVISSPFLRSIVSDSHSILSSLVLAEKLDSLDRVAAVVARLSRRCRRGSPSSCPAVAGFEHIYRDLIASGDASSRLAFSPREMDAAARKMERLAASTMALYAELEVLDELEQSARKLRSPESRRRAFDQKIQWQRHDVRHLRDQSLWNLTFEKVVLLLARSVFAIHCRIRVVFSGEVEDFRRSSVQSRQLSGKIAGPSNSSGVLISLARSKTEPDPIPCRNSFQSRQFSGKIAGPRDSWVPNSPARSKTEPDPIHRKAIGDSSDGLGRLHYCGASPGRLLMECLSLSSSTSSSWRDEPDEDRLDGESNLSLAGTHSLVVVAGDASSSFGSSVTSWKPWIASGTTKKSSSLTELAPPSTVGGSALALHYSNIVVIIEKLFRYPHLVGEEARDDLYQMLPSSMRASLRRSLRCSATKSSAIYDAPIAGVWKAAVERTMRWLAPMAHNTILWQGGEKVFEQKQIAHGGQTVLLVETLFFADRAKTEAVITELLVGLNYICRYERQQSALLGSSFDLDHEFPCSKFDHED